MEFDLVIVGGGIVGAGIARDAALRGLRVALFEKDDFASGTTSRSTRLVHGGLRYLAHYDFGLVHEALTERRTLLKIAPHLVRPLPFLLPVYKGSGHSVPVLWAGMVLYDFLQPRRGVPHHRYLPASSALRLEPTLRQKDLQGAFLFYDAQCQFPERLCLETLLDAADHGAEVHNHAPVDGLIIEGGKVRGIRTRDPVSGEPREVRAKIVVNCSGPWLDQVTRLADPDAPARLRRTKGVHLVVPAFTKQAVIFESGDASRVIFAIPWGEHTLVGTTDTDYDGVNEDVHADRDDVDYLLQELRAILDVDLRREDILFTTAGLRPLQRQLGKSTAAVTRREEIVDHAKVDGHDGLVTVVGGKLTTYRAIAEQVVDFVNRRLGYAPAACLTASHALPGGRFEGKWKAFVDDTVRQAEKHGLPADVARHLADQYGAEAFALIEAAHVQHELAGRLRPDGPWIWAQVDHAIVQEKATTLTDVLLRRLSIGLTAGQGRAEAAAVAKFMGDHLGWDAARREREVAEYLATLDRNWMGHWAQRVVDRDR